MGDHIGLGEQTFQQWLDEGDTWIRRTVSARFAEVPILDWLAYGSWLSARVLLIAFAAVLLVILLPPLTERLLRRFRCVATNFRGETIPQAFGIAILGIAVCLLAIDVAAYPHSARERLLWLFSIAAFGGLGLLDDILGDKKIKGLRGHFSALIRDRRITTGLIKAVGGLAIAVCIACCLRSGNAFHILLATGVIALSANAMNLLDLRPGRACAAFCAAAIILLFAATRRSAGAPAPSLLYVVVPALITWPRDARAKVMLGDTGSNLLGASLGLAICSYTAPSVQIAVLAGLIALHIIAERVSITKVIEGNPYLRAVDRLTGVR